IVAGETRGAVFLPRAAGRVHHALEREITERVRADVPANALDIESRSDELAAARHVDAEEALVLDRRRADAHVHFLRAVTAEELDDRAAGVAAHDRIVHDDDALALEHVR